MMRLTGFALIGMLLVVCTPALPQMKGDYDSFPGHPPNSRRWSFDGQRFLVAGGGPPSLWDLSTGKVSQIFQGHTEPVSEVAFSRDGKEVATAAHSSPWNFEPSTDNSIRLWDITSGKQVQRIDIPRDASVRLMEFSPNGKRLLTVEAINIRVWDIATGRQLFGLASALNPTGHAASFSPDLQTILVKEQGTLRLAEYTSGKERCRTTAPGAYWDAEFNSDGSQIVAVSSELPLSHPMIQILDTSNCQSIYAFSARTTSFTRASFSTDGKNIVANVGSPASAQLWRNRDASYEPLCRVAPSMCGTFR
jgi:WD40 repeat protein